jgi:hypothetical protein
MFSDDKLSTNRTEPPQTNWMNMTLKQHISCSKLAKLLDICPRTVRNWATDPVNPLPGLRVKGGWLFDEEQVQAWLDNHKDTVDVDAAVNALLTKFKEK